MTDETEVYLDQAVAKLNAVWEVVNEYFGDPLKWDKPMNGRSVMLRVRRALIDEN